MKIKNKGFTLIEMLIVIAIISILSSIFLVGLRGFRGGAYDSRRIADLQKIQSYLEIYYTKYRTYPDTSNNWTSLQGMLRSAGITSIPNDPLFESAGQTYYYGVDTNDFQSYILGAKFSTSDHASLRESTEPDGTILGVDCDDPVFCVQI
ncbi:MAG: prepilin-type N-terminal cleavage/methylation domain-containing protein [Patescibacteria group bacterium]